MSAVKDITTVLRKPDGSSTSTDQETAEELKKFYQQI